MAFMTDQPAINFDYSQSISLEVVRQDVILALQLLSAFYLGRLTCVSERYGFEKQGGRYMSLYDRRFHINLHSVGSGFRHARIDPEFIRYGSALQAILEISNRFPGISDLFWHSSVHAKTVSRIAIDSFLTAGRLTEEIYTLMFESELTDEKPRKNNSSIKPVLEIIDRNRPFCWVGEWKNSSEIFDYYQCTRNYYAHGSTRARKKVVYGFDINFLAFAIHIHLFAVLGELLGFDRETMFAASRHELELYHHHYLSRKVIGSPVSNLTRKCEWKFA